MSDIQDNTIKVSVIVPIWNAKERISRCLDSLLSQTLRDIEIICVLDCPTDGTDHVVEEYASRDSRIVVVRNEKNLHVAGSRNVGLRMARGEFVGFSDHDDYNDCSKYEVLYAKAKKTEANIVVSDATSRYIDGHCKRWHFDNFSRHTLIESDILPMLPELNPQMMSHCVWHSIYKRSLIIEQGIYFRDRNEFLDEDRLFNMEMYVLTNKIEYVPKSLYTWDQLTGSESSRRNYNIAERQIRRTQYMVQFLREHGCYDEFSDAIHTLVALELKIYFADYLKLQNPHRVVLKKLLQDIDFPYLTANYMLRTLSRKRLIIYRFLFLLMI